MLWWVLGAIAALGAVLAGPLMSRVEQPKYHVIETAGRLQIRDYPPMVVAEVALPGPREAALEQGFKLIAGYIFGKNSTASKVAMTAPVIQQAEAGRSGEKIAMTAPVVQQADGALWRVRFVMPAGDTIASLPKPDDARVKLLALPVRRFAVIRFSGLAGSRSLRKHTAQLRAFVRAQHLQPVGAPMDAYYNPPWTLPFLRRNEVMLEVAR